MLGVSCTKSDSECVHVCIHVWCMHAPARKAVLHMYTCIYICTCTCLWWAAQSAVLHVLYVCIIHICIYTCAYLWWAAQSAAAVRVLATLGALALAPTYRAVWALHAAPYLPMYGHMCMFYAHACTYVCTYVHVCIHLRVCGCNTCMYACNKAARAAPAQLYTYASVYLYVYCGYINMYVIYILCVCAYMLECFPL
jgi:hypothetical protein